MSTLFTIRESWYQQPWLYERLGHAVKGDTVLLMQDAVLALQSPLALASFTAKCTAYGIVVKALLEDCQIRGITQPTNGIELVDYTGFVNLAATHEKQVAW